MTFSMPSGFGAFVSSSLSTSTSSVSSDARAGSRSTAPGRNAAIVTGFRTLLLTPVFFCVPSIGVARLARALKLTTKLQMCASSCTSLL